MNKIVAALTARSGHMLRKISLGSVEDIDERMGYNDMFFMIIIQIPPMKTVFHKKTLVIFLYVRRSAKRIVKSAQYIIMIPGVYHSPSRRE
ncbi:MAG: hypothetical protein U1A23_03930 [Candidatus Sungbacteria bacterium]|nr:hypothetical protein [Candidatus Sungbacteria bacterium]